VFRPGVGAARQAGYLSGQEGALREELLQGAASIANAVARYVREVKADEFPGAGHDF
jgi:ketopantoate hydroxymethyltransferase